MLSWAPSRVEYAFTDHLTAKLEYLHVDLGKDTYFGSTSDISRGRWLDDGIRVGLNYKF